MYRIFHGKHVLILTKKEEIKSDRIPDFIFKKPKEEQIKAALKVSKRSTKPLTIVFIGNPDKILMRIQNEFKVVEAAGGLVHNSKGELLFIKRLGKWDIPKGKIKKNENLETCAIREIEEETGVSGLSIERFFTQTYHTYFRNEKWILKKSYWFIVNCENGENTVPQVEEDIEEVKWFKIENLDIDHLNTYPAISWILKKYQKVMRKIS